MPNQIMPQRALKQWKIKKFSKTSNEFLGGKIVKTFSWGLGIKMKNEAEWLALYHGLDLIDWGSTSKLLSFGDSRQVIQKMQSRYSKGSIGCKKKL